MDEENPCAMEAWEMYSTFSVNMPRLKNITKKKALALRQKIGFKENEALCYANLGSVCNFLGQHDNAKEHLEKW